VLSLRTRRHPSVRGPPPRCPGSVTNGFPCAVAGWLLLFLKLTVRHWNAAETPKRKDRLPNINFQELMLVSGRGYSMGGVGVRWGRLKSLLANLFWGGRQDYFSWNETWLDTSNSRQKLHSPWGDLSRMNCYKKPVKTSSTAQGGGGSFKNRKSIGEIACCESWMSEQKHWPTD